MGPMDLLQIKNGLISAGRKKVFLRGFNLGGWLMMEGYILGGRNIPEKEFKKKLARAQGQKALREFSADFRNNFIREEDLARIKKLGANCVRLPFNQRLIEPEDRPGYYDPAGLAYLKKAVSWCRQYRLYAILDLHAATGSQNPDWHADSSGKKKLWRDRQLRGRTVKVWRYLAAEFKNDPAIAGYDILNEPVCEGAAEMAALKDFYRQTVKAIRQVDPKHIIFLEANHWATDLEVLGRPAGANIAYSVHFYEPVRFVFNYQPDLTWPNRKNGIFGSRAGLMTRLQGYQKLAKKWRVPILVGEFGINWRNGTCGEKTWVGEILKIFDQLGWHWTYWTYKAVNVAAWPNGLYQYQLNPPWVKRQGPVSGWENFYELWPKLSGKISRSWRTKKFKSNRDLVRLLKKYFKRRPAG